MHTWKTNDDRQNVWENIIPQKIDYSEYTLLSPNVYQLDNEDDFLESIDMNKYWYKDIWDKHGHSHHGEWLPKLVSNLVCMLESQKRAVNMVKTSVMNGDRFKFVMFVRPDVTIYNDLPISAIFSNYDKIHVPDYNHFEGINDTFAVMNYENACIFGKRIDELEEFRKTHGRIVSEKYLKYFITKYNIPVNPIHFVFSITRP